MIALYRWDHCSGRVPVLPNTMRLEMEEPWFSLAGLALLLPPPPSQVLMCVFCEGWTERRLMLSLTGSLKRGWVSLSVRALWQWIFFKSKSCWQLYKSQGWSWGPWVEFQARLTSAWGSSCILVVASFPLEEEFPEADAWHLYFCNLKLSFQLVLRKDDMIVRSFRVCEMYKVLL